MMIARLLALIASAWSATRRWLYASEPPAPPPALPAPATEAVGGSTEPTHAPATGTIQPLPPAQPPPVPPPRSPVVDWVIADLYWADLGALPKFRACAEWPQCGGVILKATEGVRYAHAQWFLHNWRRVREAAGDRYGRDFVRGAYHYLLFPVDGARQGAYYLDVVDQAGGWDHGDVLPICDFERGGENSPNYHATRDVAVRCAEAFREFVHKRTGREVILYGRGELARLGVTSKMGFRWAWNPSYTRHPHPMPAPWRPEDTILDQYTDGDVNVTGPRLPGRVPGFGDVDLSHRRCTAAEMVAILTGRDP